MLLIRGFRESVRTVELQQMPAASRAGAAKLLAGRSTWLPKSTRETKEFEDAELSLVAKLMRQQETCVVV